MKNFIALCALGVVAVDGHKHHKKSQQLHAKKISNQALQQEIEELRASYQNLEKKFDSMSQNMN